jgi:uncharacterized membrane protein
VSPAALKLIHLLGVFVLFMAVGAASLHAMRASSGAEEPRPKPIAMAHGIGLLTVLAAGVAMLVTNGWGMPGWIHGKLLVWFLFGASLAVLGKRPASARWLAVVLPVLGLVAGALAIYKPGA